MKDLKENNIVNGEDNNKERKHVINDKEKSFNNLCSLQKLVKRESALKELCKNIYLINVISYPNFRK